MTPLTDACSLGSIYALGDFSNLDLYCDEVIFDLRYLVRDSIYEAVRDLTHGWRMSVRDLTK
jgi:hypothetical protein